jgi:hypothetical protein
MSSGYKHSQSFERIKLVQLINNPANPLNPENPGQRKAPAIAEAENIF